MNNRKEEELLPPREGAPQKIFRRSFEERLRAVKLQLEEGFTQELIAQEMEVSVAAVNKWVRLYRLHGEEGLKDKGNGRRGPRRRADPQQDSRTQKPGTFRGIKRISQLLKRVFFLQASPETVRKTLKEQGLIEPRPSRGVTWSVLDSLSEPHPIRCSRTDIFTFRLGGRYAYLIGFMDDYSRFIVGADLSQSHRRKCVGSISVAAGEYQPPKEMLTDNGRGKINWRGITRFQAEMKKNGTHHFIVGLIIQ